MKLTNPFRVLSYASILAAVLVYVSLALYSEPVLDQARDIFFAQKIVNDPSWVLGGTVINNTFQLGPVWFYICALPLLFGGGYASVVAFIAFLSALKFPLAYCAGRLLRGERFGLLLAFAVLVTGWAWLPLHFLTHPACVETALWLLLCFLLRWQRAKGPLLAGLVGLSAALAIHAHPSTIGIAGLACFWVLFGCFRNADWKSTLALIAGSVVLFAPYFYEQALQGWQVFSSAGAYVKSDVAWPDVARTARLVMAAFLHGHSYELRYMGQLPDFAVEGFVLFFAAILLVFLLAALNRGIRSSAERPSYAQILLWSLAIILLQAAFLTTLRPITPFWMLYGLLPFAAIFIAAGLVLLHENRIAKVLAPLTAIALCIAALLPVSAYLHNSRTFYLPSVRSDGLLDVSFRPREGHAFNIAYLKTVEVDPLVAVLGRTDIVHGHAAAFIESIYGGVEKIPRQRGRLQLGGSESPLSQPTRIAGYADTAWAAIGRKADFQTPGMGWIVPKNIVHPLAGEHIALPVSPRIFHARTQFDEVREFAVRFSAPCQHTIAVTNMIKLYLPLLLVGASADGMAVASGYQDDISIFLSAPRCVSGTNVNWELKLHSSPAAVDIVSF